MIVQKLCKDFIVVEHMQSYRMHQSNSMRKYALVAFYSATNSFLAIVGNRGFGNESMLTYVLHHAV